MNILFYDVHWNFKLLIAAITSASLMITIDKLFNVLLTYCIEVIDNLRPILIKIVMEFITTYLPVINCLIINDNNIIIDFGH